MSLFGDINDSIVPKSAVGKLNMKFAKSISAEVENNIMSKAILTGSQLLGCSGPDSDWDYILPPGTIGEDGEDAWDYIFNNGGVYGAGYFENDFKSIYFKDGAGNLCNAICCSSEVVFRKWTRATSLLVDMAIHTPWIMRAIQDKGDRVRLFELLKELA